MKLSDHLKNCNAIATCRVIPIVDGSVYISIKDGSGTITATDLEKEYIGYFNSDWPNFDGVVSIKLLSRALSLIADPIVTIGDNNLTLSGQGSVSIQFFESADWPKMEQVDSDPIPVNSDRIKLLSNFVGTDSLRPALTGVYLGPEYYAATDAHILLQYTECTYPSPVIIPAAVAKLATSKLATTETHGLFSSPDYKITFRLIEERYPNVAAVIPESNNPEAVNYDFGPILPILDPNIPRFSIKDNHLIMMDIDLGFEANIPVSGLPDIGFATKIFNRVTKIATTFEVIAADKAAVHRAPGMIALIMPVFNRN